MNDKRLKEPRFENLKDKVFKSDTDSGVSLIPMVSHGASQLDDEVKFPHDRLAHLNASEGGRCLKWQWFSKRQPEVLQDQKRGFMRRGKDIEDWVVDVLTRGGAKTLMMTEQDTLVDKHHKIAGTPDGIVKLPDPAVGVYMLEIKSFDNMTDHKNLPREEHVAQVMTNIWLANRLATDKISDFAGCEPPYVRGGVILYVNASNYDEILEFYIPPPDKAFIETLLYRRDVVLNGRKPDLIIQEGAMRDNARECKYGKNGCPFKAQCGVTIDTSKQTVAKANAGTPFEVAAKELFNLRQTKKADADREKELAGIIKMELQGRNAKKLVIGNSLEASLIDYKGRDSLDKEAVARAGIDLSPYQKTGAGYQVVKLTDLTEE